LRIILPQVAHVGKQRKEAAKVEVFPLRDANRALNSLKNDAIGGAAMLRVS
jgi:hypothetical protein